MFRDMPMEKLMAYYIYQIDKQYWSYKQQQTSAIETDPTCVSFLEIADRRESTDVSPPPLRGHQMLSKVVQPL